MFACEDGAMLFLHTRENILSLMRTNVWDQVLATTILVIFKIQTYIDVFSFTY